MRYVPLKKAEPGMVLAADLYDSVGRTLIGCHCELTESYLEKLEAYGFDGVYIEDKLSEGITIESVITPQLRQEGQERIRACDIDGCKLIARRMVEEILSCGNVSLDLTDLRSYDDYTYAHSVNVAVYCGVIGMGMGMSEVELGHLVTAALLHDLGKLQIPDEILNKPGRLTQEEYLIMKSHATLSYQIISERWDISAHIKEAVLHHHENVDGSGYPDGLEGAQQTMFTRILHVADVYDALTSRRPYKEPYAPYEATEYLMGGCGIMFDREVVETLLKYVPLYPKGTMVTLSDGREAIIYENFGVHNLRPVVRLMDGELLDLSNEANYHITLRMKTESGFSTEEAEKERNEMIRPPVRCRIMVVDDMKTNLQMLRGILEPLYDVILMKSGHQALLYLKKHPAPDLVLMDIRNGVCCGAHKPSSEKGVHLAAYQTFPEVGYVIHTHQTYATAIGLCGFEQLAMTEEEAEAEEKKGNHVTKVADGYRRIVAAPKPVDIVEMDAIRALTDADQIVVACGGGGIPVLSQDNNLKGASAVIEKDLAAGKLAELLEADMLVILTSVDNVCLDYGTENERPLNSMTVAEAKKYMEQGQFGEGDMQPKIQAAIDFIGDSAIRSVLITKLHVDGSQVTPGMGTMITK